MKPSESLLLLRAQVLCCAAGQYHETCLVDVFTIPNLDHENQKPFADYLVNHSIVSDSKSDELLGTLQVLDPGRVWVTLQTLDPFNDLAPDVLGKRLQLFQGRWEKIDRIGRG
jgi:hypothetical protein